MCDRANRLALRGCVTTSYTLFLYWVSPRATTISSLPFNALATNLGALRSGVSWCTCHVICHELGRAMELSTFHQLLMHISRTLRATRTWSLPFDALATSYARIWARCESCTFHELVVHISRIQSILRATRTSSLTLDALATSYATNSGEMLVMLPCCESCCTWLNSWHVQHDCNITATSLQHDCNMNMLRGKFVSRIGHAHVTNWSTPRATRITSLLLDALATNSDAVWVMYIAWTEWVPAHFTNSRSHELSEFHTRQRLGACLLIHLPRTRA